MWGPVINPKSGKSWRGFLLMSKICLVYLRLGLKALMGNERLNETLSMFSIVAKSTFVFKLSPHGSFFFAFFFGLTAAVALRLNISTYLV